MSTATSTRPACEVVDFDEILPADCPCGQSRRAFVYGDGLPSLHRVDIAREDFEHRHNVHEIYYILTCGPNAAMVLNGERIPVRPRMAVDIPGGTWHYADCGGKPMQVLVFVTTGHGSPQAKMEYREGAAPPI